MASPASARKASRKQGAPVCDRSSCGSPARVPRQGGRHPMESALYVSLSSQLALENRLDTIADNVANAEHGRLPRDGSEVRPADLALGGSGRLLRLAGQGLSVDPFGRTEEDRQRAGFRRQGRWLVRDRHAGRSGADARRPVLHDARTATSSTIKGYPVLDAGGAPDPARSHRRDAGRRSGRLADPERQARRRDRALQRRSRRRLHPVRELRRDPGQAPLNRSSTGPTRASCRAMSRSRTSIRSPR